MVVSSFAPMSWFLGSTNKYCQLIRLWEYHPLTPLGNSLLTEIPNFRVISWCLSIDWLWFLYMVIFSYFLSDLILFLEPKLFKFRARHILLKYRSRYVIDYRGYFCLAALDSVQHGLSMSCWWLSSPVASWKVRTLYISARLYHVLSEGLI